MIGSLIALSAQNRGAITSIVERKTKLTILLLLDGPTSKASKEGIIRRLTRHKIHVITLTSDNGKEFAGYAKISEKLGSGFYFCTTYHVWERGLNENTNWLVRQYYPKGTDVAKLAAADVLRVEDLLNNRPRKALNYHSTNEVFAKLTAPPKIYALDM